MERTDTFLNGRGLVRTINGIPFDKCPTHWLEQDLGYGHKLEAKGNRTAKMYARLNAVLAELVRRGKEDETRTSRRTNEPAF